MLSGDDGITLPMMAVGARGVISVTSNVLPRETSAVTTAFLAGKLDEARRAHAALLELHALMFIEPNPAPAKAALASMGRMTPAVRGPLVPASESATARVKDALAKLTRAST